MSYTKGPWEVGLDDASYGDIPFIQIETNSQAICRVECDNDFSLGNEQRANANLIAAAPEMLEALEWIHEEAKSEFAMYESSSLGKSVKEAIAKAKGQL